MRTEIRTFIAIKIHPGEKVLNQLNDFKTIFKKDGIRWVHEDNFHLTLRFIGNTTREQLCFLVDNLKLVAGNLKSFQIETKGVGCFSSKGKPRVLFVKIMESEALTELVAEVEKNVVAAGFHAELKPFRPHLTLGRIKNLERRVHFHSVIEELDDIKYQDSYVSEFILYQSILKPEGPIYKPIKIFKLR